MGPFANRSGEILDGLILGVTLRRQDGVTEGVQTKDQLRSVMEISVAQRVLRKGGTPCLALPRPKLRATRQGRIFVF
jgi:hypothetical protein